MNPTPIWGADGASFQDDLSSTQAAPASNLYGRKVDQIRVKGLKRIEEDAVLGKLSTRKGSELRAEKVREDISRIFEMGYFDDIEVVADASGSNEVDLTYVLKERPVIAEIEYRGNEKVDTKDLEEVTKVKQWSIFDVNKISEDIERIQQHYEEKGYYLAKVSYEAVPLAEDQVKLIWKIQDFEKVRIKDITFLNNKAFSDEKLKSILAETQEGGPFSFISGSGSFKETSFRTDLQRLTYWYLDNGYVKFRYENPVITVSDDKKWLYISIYVDEGEKYEITGDIDFSGDLLFTTEELREGLTLKQGEVFSITKRNLDIQFLTEKYQDLGYAFVNVIPKMDIKDEEKTISLSYDFEKGELVYFGEVRVLSNSKTRDRVIRRELKVNEGELYSGSKLRQSRENVERLGYFAPGEVIFNTVTRKGESDVLDIEITVKERSTGTITLGAGYGSQQGPFFTGQISEINLFGKGQTISLSAQYASANLQKSFSLGFTDPYTFGTTWSTGFDAFYVVFPIPDKYNTRRFGFNLRAGHPIAEFTRLFLTYKLERMQVQDAPATIDPAEIAADDGLLSSVVLSGVRDKRNNRFETTAGNYQSLSLETAGLGGDKKFVKTSANNRVYAKLFGDLVFRNSLQIGHIFSLGERVPPTERFYLGGPNNLRGFSIFQVGPLRTREQTTSGGDTVTIREPLGGRTELYGLFELEHPLIRDAGLKGVLFFDVGNVFADTPDFDAFTVRADWGWGFRWFSPIGPLRFEFGYPFARRTYEDQMVFNFFIGTPF